MKLTNLALLCTLLTPVCYASGGIGLESTRLIYTSDMHSANVVVNNSDDALNYLIQPSISRNLESEVNAPFVLSPSLFRIKHGAEGVIKISALSPEVFPKDRESVYWLTVKAVPASEKKITAADIGKLSGGVKVAVGNTIKLFYRPSDLQGDAISAAAGLDFKKLSTNTVDIINNSAFYVSLQSLTVNGEKASSKAMLMVPPYGELKVNTEKPVSTIKHVKWQAINDNGGMNTYDK